MEGVEEKGGALVAGCEAPLLVGTSAVAREVNERIRRFAQSRDTVLILGATGTGKERVAAALHALGRPSGSPFVALNAGGLSPQLLEGDLFGHTRGAFTGAVGAKRGAFLNAEDGTLFLDEIGDMPLEQQPKLLRALQMRLVRPLGADAREYQVRARVIAATNVDLEERVREGRFREDLLYRLALRIVLAPLAQRREDIPLLARELTPQGLGLASDAIDWLTQREWPGNVRELENVLKLASHYADHGEITAATLRECTAPSLSTRTTSGPRRGARGLRDQHDEEQRRALAAAFVKHDGNVTRTALEVGLPRKTAEYQLRLLGLRPKR